MKLLVPSLKQNSTHRGNFLVILTVRFRMNLLELIKGNYAF